MSSTRPFFLVATLLVFSRPASAQHLLREHVGGFGYSVSGLRDVDRDGVADYAMNDWSSTPERIRIRSGRTGAAVFAIDGGQPSSWSFGYALSDAGDVDGDGIPDLVVGAPYYVDPLQTFVDCGGVFAYSGADGHLLQAAYGSADSDALGGSVAGLGDVDGDGCADFLAGADQIFPLGARNGYVRCYSGKSGAILYQVDGTASDSEFGYTVAALSDHDGDGIRDFAITSFLYTSICSGATGATIATIPPSPTLSNAGGVCEIDDLDGDGEPEIVIGEVDSTQDGQARVVSIPTQTRLRLHIGTDHWGNFGANMATIADADGDGVRDYLIGAAAPTFGSPGSASLFSGRTGARLYRFVDPAADWFMGWSLASAGDLDGDGRSEVLIGSPYHHDSSGDAAVLVLSGNDLWLNADPKQPVAGVRESLETHGAPAGDLVALFLVDVNGTPLPHLLAFGTADAAEAFVVQALVPPGLAGTTMTFRSYALDLRNHLMTSGDESVRFQ